MFAHGRSTFEPTRASVTISRRTDRKSWRPTSDDRETGRMTSSDAPESARDLEATLDALHESEQRLLRTVDSLPVDTWPEPSGLPDWSRAHVVAHLALNAEGLAGAVDGLAREHVVPIYESNARRNDDIEELARADLSSLRDRLFAAGQGLRDALASLDPGQWDGTIRRLPDGPIWPVAFVPATRRREVEIHHADLDAGYGHGDWPADFCVELLDSVTASHADSADSPVFTIRATDTVRTWAVGAEQPVVEGTAADLGWWLVGRGAGGGLTCDAGELPRLGPWGRTPAK
jgi:maleylpyruvate isomerase